ncbi:hypothetical protein BDW75DRAFT_245731 [Aspergillus navahoensis]
MTRNTVQHHPDVQEEYEDYICSALSSARAGAGASLDIALLNAGIAPTLLAILLMPTLKRAERKNGHSAQLTFTGSFAHLYVEASDADPFSLTSGPKRGLLNRLNAPESLNVKKSNGVIKAPDHVY